MGIMMKTIEAVALAAALWVSTASAEESAAAHSRATIERQFEAFARDDAEAAYALADPTIKQMFVDPDHFLAMVRDRYARSTDIAASSLATSRNPATTRALQRPSSTMTMSYGLRSTA